MNDERDPGVSAGVAGSAENYSGNVVLGAEGGHGYAAEKANHLADVLLGEQASLPGGNRRDGADRIVNGLEIQSKYCKSGTRCIRACFSGGRFRYMGHNGPMLVEVPSDKYDAAVQAMEHRIRKGQVPGISDPVDAKDLVRKGRLTYAQARNIARFGTIESLTYDAASGIRLAGTSMGISAAVVFALGVWNGEDIEVTLRRSCMTGLRVGSLAWVSSILAAQFGRTGIERGLRGTADWAVRQLGPEVVSSLASGLQSGTPVYGAAAANHLSKLIRGHIVSGGATTLILSSGDLVELLRGRMSAGQVTKNLATTAVGIAGGSAGWMVGSAVGASVGSAIRWIGPDAGRLVGGLTGSVLGASGASRVASVVLDRLIEDDAKEMMRILEAVFGKLAQEYLLGPREARDVIDELMGAYDLRVKLRNMYGSDDRSRFAEEWLRPLVEQQARQRQRIALPSENALLERIRRTGAVASFNSPCRAQATT